MSEKFDQIKGKVKETAGKVFDDKETENEGKTEDLSAQAKEAVNDVKDSVKGAVDGVKNSFSDDKE
ncbi:MULTISPECIES: CsbD family protein [Aerococcus]|uniref:CsbD family protein n=3 Tax=Aerococcus TaxID=1375 RepID=A0A109RE37_9LACT|nr:MULTISPECIES: CsbD family protein [Aerococcus]AEA01649.1 CsbD-like protein [Aerococcus sp. Group 1]AMB95256.1 hypothetical protein AWM73_01425 [Aerococcus urinae]KAA9217911.1 CsbD family protein [Aerococcus loyolae]KAA9241545.1 CsbD family protein [Aerococcus urinae]KAA9266908.1 CsbD family protein [Aerococcus loyolae]